MIVWLEVGGVVGCGLVLVVGCGLVLMGGGDGGLGPCSVSGSRGIVWEERAKA